jgi:hypothetical protein
VTAVLLAVGVFASGVVSESFWTLWTRRANEGRWLPAACASIVITLLSFVNIASPLTFGLWLLIPMCLGLACGLKLTLAYDARRELAKAGA